MRIKLLALAILLCASGCLFNQGAKVTDAAKADSQTAKTAEPKPELITGHCRCGQCRYEAQGPVVKCGQCNCAACQRMSGQRRASFVTVESGNFRITSGTPAAQRGDTDAQCDVNGEWFLCPSCKTPLYWKSDRDPHTDLFANTLDKSRFFDRKKIR